MPACEVRAALTLSGRVHSNMQWEKMRVRPAMPKLRHNLPNFLDLPASGQVRKTPEKLLRLKEVLLGALRLVHEV